MSGQELEKDKLIEKRKEDHIKLVVSKNTQASYNFWDDVILEHNAIPEIDYDEISTEAVFLGKKIGYPVMIVAITGGFKKGMEINEYLAKISEKYQIPMGVGSQRAALVKKELKETYSIIREYDVPVRVGNIGAPQLLSLSIDDIQTLVDMIDAHAIAVHLNYLQEVVQPEGDLISKGLLEKIQEISKSLNVPVIVKETGAGFSYKVALKVLKTGIKGIDSSGVSGTSFSAIEYYRALENQDSVKANLGKILWDWGIPAPVSLINCKRAVSRLRKKVYIIGSGGIRHGLDAARALVLGADVAGIARRALEAYFNKTDLSDFIKELKAIMFLTGSKNVKDLRSVKYHIVGRLKEYI